MSFFVDTNVVIYAAGKSEYGEPCLELLREIAAGRSEGRTSTAVVEEAWHVPREQLRLGMLATAREHLVRRRRGEA